MVRTEPLRRGDVVIVPLPGRSAARTSNGQGYLGGAVGPGHEEEAVDIV